MNRLFQGLAAACNVKIIVELHYGHLINKPVAQPEVPGYSRNEKLSSLQYIHIIITALTAANRPAVDYNSGFQLSKSIIHKPLRTLFIIYRH